MVMIRYREFENFNFSNIFRIYISGSSAAGKTYFAKELLESTLFSYNRIYYFHPDFHENSPVEWDKTLKKEVFYQAGLPTLSEMLEMPKKSCLVFDDLFSQCCESKDIDYLFRVLSSKRELNVIIMTQRYFAEGKNRLGLSIRNSCNYHVLMNNADARTNINVGNCMQLKPEISRANIENKSKLYPYIFIDKTNQARVNGLQVFVDLFGKYKVVLIGSMKYYLLSEADFKANFRILGSNVAEKNENKKRKLRINNHRQKEESTSGTESSQSSQSSSEESSSSSDSDNTYQRERSKYTRKTINRNIRKH